MPNFYSIKQQIKRTGKVFIPMKWRLPLKEKLKKLLKRLYAFKPKYNIVKIRNDIKAFTTKPLVSIIFHVNNESPTGLSRTIQSVSKQFYKNWELCLVADASSSKSTITYLSKLRSTKIKIRSVKKGFSIANTLNKAVEEITGDYIIFIQQNGELTRNALFEVVKVINKRGSELIYTDEGVLAKNYRFFKTHHKPGFSIDLLLSQNFFGNSVYIKKQLFASVGGFDEKLEGAHAYDLYLKCIEHSERICHIPKILYHSRGVYNAGEASIANVLAEQEQGVEVLENYLERNTVSAKVHPSQTPTIFRIKRDINSFPLVSILIPFKDKPALLKICIDSILEKSTYKNFEIIGISNNSEEQETFDLLSQFENDYSFIKFYELNEQFNFSRISNYASHLAKGEHLILLNNDIEIISKDWIEAMLEHSQRPEIGAVGAKLYYPNDTIQHAGVIIGLGGVAGHAYSCLHREDIGYGGRLMAIQNFAAVTAACLMVKRSLYLSMGGFDEDNLKIAFNDVDFCLRLVENGYLNVFTPYCEAYHHESISRGKEDSIEKKQRFKSEVDYMMARHKKILKAGDPFNTLIG